MPVSLSSAEIRSFLASDLGVDTSVLRDDTPLFSSGLIDSFSLVSLLSFIEDTAKIQMNPGDVSLDNLDSIDLILAYLQRIGA